MIVGIEQTTDRRSPETRVVRLRSLREAQAWVAKPVDFAWSGAADPTLPMGQRNFHRRLREAYEMPAGWRMPTRRVVQAQRGPRPWEDRRSDADIIALLVSRAGTPITTPAARPDA